MNTAQRAFSTGEVSPSLYARTDLAKYATALRVCRNFICLRDGGVTTRPGTEFVATAAGTVCRLLPFVFNDSQSYILAFTNLLITIYQDGAPIGVTVVTPYLAADLFQLQISQSADVIEIVHVGYPPQLLSRVSALVWTLTAGAFGSPIAAPTGLAVSGTLSADHATWGVTAVDSVTGIESPVASITSSDVPTSTAPSTVSWTPVAGASAYNVYRTTTGSTTYAGYRSTGVYGFVGSVTASPMVDVGAPPDFSIAPPHTMALFAAPGDYPAAIGSYQQRRILGGTTNNPEEFFASRTALPTQFTSSFPTQDDDAIAATLLSKKVNAIRHIVDGETLFILTSGGEWMIRGDSAGILLPTAINAVNFSKHGSSTVPPIQLDRRILYVQARQSIVRQIVPNDVGPGYEGENMTLLSSHLFKGYTITDWAYQEEPHSIVWCVRSDGTLIAMTDLEEQKVLAWHRHDTDGLVESVCVIPEGDEDRLYMVVNRNGVHMIERMASRFFTAIDDGVFADASLSYDGRNTTAETMTLSGSTSWDSGELVTVTRSVGGFVSGDVGNRIDFVDAAGLALRVTLEEYDSGNVMKGFPNRLIPAELRVATSVWTRAVDTVTGLAHLNGRALSVLGDGTVVASPNNPNYDDVNSTVVAGSLTLPQPYGRIRAGLPYLSDIETLDLDSPSGASLKDKKLLVNSVIVYMQDSRGFFAGQSLPDDDDAVADMDEAKVRDIDDDYDPIGLSTTTEEVKIPAHWESTGRVAIRNVDPLPLTVLAVIPRGHIASD